MGIRDILLWCLRKEVKTPIGSGWLTDLATWSWGKDGRVAIFYHSTPHTRVLWFLLQTHIRIVCPAKSLTFLVTFQDTKCLAWHTTLRHSHFICEKAHWKISVEEWEFLEGKKSAKQDSQGWGWGKAPRSACWD